MLQRIFKSRYSIVLFFCTLFVALSFILRILFAFWIKADFDWSPLEVVKVFSYGLLYDITVVSCFSLVFTFYLMMIGKRFVNSIVDKLFLSFIFIVNSIIIYFTFFAEITFWDEFKSRFNFIAVDYLIYTYEVVKNIEESYPLPLLIGGILCITAITLFVAYKVKSVYYTMHHYPRLLNRVWISKRNLDN